MRLLQRFAATVCQILRRGYRVTVARQIQAVQRFLRYRVYGVLCKSQAFHWSRKSSASSRPNAFVPDPVSTLGHADSNALHTPSGD